MSYLILSFQRAGLSLLACSALTRACGVALLLAALWGAIYWADALA